MAGLLRVLGNAQLDQIEADKLAANNRQQDPVILGLAAHLRRLWHPAWLAKKPVEDRMLRALRQRNGQYEPTKLTEIQAQGGSEVFMMLTETKCRGAESWLRDILLDDGKIPFSVSPTPVPDLPPDMVDTIHQKFANKVINTIQSTGQAPDPDLMDELKEAAEQDIRFELLEAAQNRCDRMQSRIEDQFEQGGMVEAFSEFISDLTTYPAAFIKGPIVCRQRSMQWVKDAQGAFVPQVDDTLSPAYKRVDPYRIYPEPGITRIGEGYMFEHHRLSRPEVSELIGVPGYDDGAIRELLDEMPTGGLSNWMWSAEMQKSELEQKHNVWMRPTEVVDALEFWGKVPGKLLLEWGLTPEEIPDAAKEYDVNAWLVGRWVIKATLNYDPLGKQPYRKTCFFKRPGAFWGTGLPEMIEDVQAVCNAAARSLVNNMGLASGPQVEVNIDRMPEGEEITKLYPWKIWQTLNDPLGSGQPAIRFNQPDDRSSALMTVYDHFSKLADDQSGIPAYVYGDMDVGGAGRTASGLNMLMGSAGKGIRQVVMYIDMDVIAPSVEGQFNWNMRYDPDPAIKGDAIIQARGAINLANREQLNVRRIEFLNATANPIDSQIIGIPGRASILREVAKGLSMPIDDIVPSKEKLEVQQKLQQLMPQPAQPGAPGQAPAVGVPPTHPGGMPMGGAESNQVSPQQPQPA
jgi:hypothetical protein